MKLYVLDVNGNKLYVVASSYGDAEKAYKGSYVIRSITLVQEKI